MNGSRCSLFINNLSPLFGASVFVFIDREAREIMYLVAPVRPSVSLLMAELFDLRLYVTSRT